MSKTGVSLIVAGAAFPSIAQMTQGGSGILEVLGPLIQLGAVGAILAWYLVKQEPRLKAIESELQTLSRSVLLNTLASPHASEAIKSASNELIAEIDRRSTVKNPRK